MKELILIRHAKSDWAGEGIKDIDRPLSERGCKDAYMLSSWFSENEPLPELIISSPATRALSTALIYARAFGFDENEIVLNAQLYESTVTEYKNAISQLNNNYNSAILFGHNPVITNLINSMNDEIEFENIPTCGMVKIRFIQDNWKGVAGDAAGKIVLQKFPKNFKQ